MQCNVVFHVSKKQWPDQCPKPYRVRQKRWALWALRMSSVASMTSKGQKQIGLHAQYWKNQEKYFKCNWLWVREQRIKRRESGSLHLGLYLSRNNKQESITHYCIYYFNLNIILKPGGAIKKIHWGNIYRQHHYNSFPEISPQNSIIL